MATTVVFGMFMALLFGGMMLALVMGYRSTEQARAREEAERQQASLATSATLAEIPRFFVDAPVEPATSSAEAPHDEIIGQIESYLRAEHALVAKFVNDPSLENLYRQSGPSPMLH